MLLSVLSFPVGHFYVKRGLTYVIITVLFILLISILTHNEIILIITGCFVSSVLMFLRFKIQSIKILEQGGKTEGQSLNSE